LDFNPRFLTLRANAANGQGVAAMAGMGEFSILNTLNDGESKCILSSPVTRVAIHPREHLLSPRQEKNKKSVSGFTCF
jgi:hypothetical protein